MPLLPRQKQPVERKEPTTVRVKLIADECGLLMGCLSWVNCELELMKMAAQKIDEKKKETKAIVGDERAVEKMTRDTVDLVDTLAPLVRYQEECLLSLIRESLDDNGMVSRQDRDKFLETIQKRIEAIQDIQDTKVKLDWIWQVLTAVGVPG